MGLLEAELKKAGLQDKQARVYLALLELGPSSIQKIARKASVARATTYVVIDSLLKYGLVTKASSGKRPMFVAEEPHHLLHLLERKQQMLQDCQRDLQQLVPTLQAMYKGQHQQPSVRYYPGQEGLRAIRHEMTMQCTRKDVWYNLASADQLRPIFGEKNLYCRSRAAKGVWSKTIFTTTSDEVKEQLLNNSVEHRTERRFIAPENATVPTGITICRDKVAIGSFEENIGGMVIQNPALAQTLRQFFNLIWKKLDA